MNGIVILTKGVNGEVGVGAFDRFLLAAFSSRR